MRIYEDPEGKGSLKTRGLSNKPRGVYDRVGAGGEAVQLWFQMVARLPAVTGDASIDGSLTARGTVEG